MALGMTDTEAAAVSNYRLGGGSYPAPANGGFLGLFSVPPAHGSAGTEISDSGYSRQAVSWATTTSGVVGNPNSTPLTFGPLSAGFSPAEVVYWGRWSAANGGTLLDVGLFDNAYTLSPGGSLPIAVGALRIVLDGGL